MSQDKVSRRDILFNAMASAGMVAIMPRESWAGSASPQCPSVANPPTSAPAFSGTPLGTTAASKNLLIGVQLDIPYTTAYGQSMYDSVYRQVIFREKPQFIAYGGAFKFGNVCPDPPTSNGSLVFTNNAYGISDTWYVANDLTNFVQPQGARGRADALIWNETDISPSWLKTLPPNSNANTPEYQYNLGFVQKYMSAALQKMTQLQGSNPNFFHSAGLINEPIVPNFSNPSSPTPAYFRDGPWLSPGNQVASFGGIPGYIYNAFYWGEYYRTYWAQQLGVSASTAKFYLNETLCETDQYGPTVRPALMTLLQSMISANLNIKGVGFECHLQPQMMNDPYHPDWTAFGNFIQQLGTMGLEVYITELDVLDYAASCNGQAASPADSDYLIDIYYDTFIKKMLSYTNVKMLTLWDLSDRYTFYRTFDESTWYGYNTIPRPKPANTPWPDCPTLPANTPSALPCPRPNVYDDAMKPKAARAKLAAALAAAPTR